MSKKNYIALRISDDEMSILDDLHNRLSSSNILDLSRSDVIRYCIRYSAGKILSSACSTGDGHVL